MNSRKKQLGRSKVTTYPGSWTQEWKFWASPFWKGLQKGTFEKKSAYFWGTCSLLKVPCQKAKSCLHNAHACIQKLNPKPLWTWEILASCFCSRWARGWGTYGDMSIARSHVAHSHVGWHARWLWHKEGSLGPYGCTSVTVISHQNDPSARQRRPKKWRLSPLVWFEAPLVSSPDISTIRLDSRK